MNTMRAMVAGRFGGPEVFEMRDVPVPVPPQGHVLVRVRASSVNPIDTKIRSGMLSQLAPDPVILGCDVAGEVVEAGDGVGFLPGDRVIACGGGVKIYPGALAEFMVVDAALCAPAPQGLTWEAAASLPLVGITADEGLSRAHVQAGQRVLIHAGAGGVGQMALQLAKQRGAEVWVTVSTPEKAESARKLGADGVIFYKNQSVADYVGEVTAGQGFDVVFDTVGGENVAKCFEAAAVSGTVVSISTRATVDLSPLHAKGISLHVVFMIIPILYNKKPERAAQGRALSRISHLAETASITPLLDARVFSFEQVSAAHELLESGRALGKVTLTGFP